MPPIPRGLEGVISQEQWESLNDAQRANVLKHAASYATLHRDGLQRNLQRWNAENKAAQTADKVGSFEEDEKKGPFRGAQLEAMDLYGKRARGEDSLAGEILRQQTARNVAQLMGQAASASPQNRALAARTSLLGAAQSGQAMAGQTALAQAQERAAALGGLSDLATGGRGQDIGVGEWSRGNAAKLAEQEAQRQREMAAQREAQRRALEGRLVDAGISAAAGGLSSGATSGKK